MSAAHHLDADSFRALGHRMVDQLADYLQAAQERRVPVLPVRDPAGLRAEWSASVPDSATTPGQAAERVTELLASVLEHSNHLHHPGYIGHQISVPLPMGALLEMVNALLSNGMAVFEMGQLQTIFELRVIEFLNRCVGSGEGADGVLTHGGSLGNLTALLAARQANAGHDVWTEGAQEPLSVLVSDQAHYCIARSVKIMGWGKRGAWAVPTDRLFRLDPQRLESSLRRAREAGRRVIAVIGNACSTATGSMDPLNEIAAFCKEHNLWFHVDGAHGASLTLSRRYRHRLSGIEHADSVVWDLHKMLAMPALNTAVLFRDGRHSYGAFAQDAAYLFAKDAPEEQWFNLGQRTLECTKRGMSMTAYVMLHALGAAWFEAHVDGLVDRTVELQQMLDEADDFEVAVPAEANILCFRLTDPRQPLAAEDRDRLQARIRDRVIRDGDFYLVTTRLRGELWLRVTVMNPRTDTGTLRGMIEQLHGAASLEG